MYKAKTHTKFPSLVLQNPTQLQPTKATERQNRLWGEDFSVLKVLPTDVLGKLYVFGHNCHPFSMNCAEVDIFQKPNQISLCSFLQSQYGTTWKGMSYLPTSRANSWTHWEKGIFLIRSSVLFWNQWISQRAMVPSQYFWGFLTFPALRKIVCGALPSMVGQNFILAGSSLPDIDGPASAAIWANCQVGDDSGDLPISPRLSVSSTSPNSLWVGSSLGMEGSLPLEWGVHQ